MSQNTTGRFIAMLNDEADFDAISAAAQEAGFTIVESTDDVLRWLVLESSPDSDASRLAATDGVVSMEPERSYRLH